MESLGRERDYSDTSPSSSAVHEECSVPEVTITHRLRDRRMLRKRQAETQDKDSIQCAMRVQERSKRKRRGRGSRQQRSRQPVVERSPEPEPEPDALPDPQEEADTEASELQQAVQTIQDLVRGMQEGAAEEELATKSQNPMGEEEVQNPAEAEEPEAWSTPLETDYHNNE